MPMSQRLRVLGDLKRRRTRGITALDYPPGFPIRSRISNLRQRGHIIESQQDNRTSLARYRLIQEAEA